MNYNIIDVFKDILKGNLEFVSKQEANSRFEICKKCEVRNPKLNICTICGCFLPAKTKLKKSTCPMNQW
ncbi:DUF6171 family protein [Hydrotalea sp. AMD]|uniref:DUF6171 family protein n=1 Tax=Hydrotalea sp. AMD TaxID=2501297 RepID=UPI00338F7A21